MIDINIFFLKFMLCGLIKESIAVFCPKSYLIWIYRFKIEA